ncbi:MAG: FAD-dependent monooxygenase, partial [Candidatus Eremiobacteraeota bacterium]|nr:FAD-dependent monooxygenase [Candidatus Eremiobacteraeota bacterium]
MRIAINGCGVAGPTLAWWLKKYGYEPVLFEKSSQLRTGGYIIDFWGLGFEVAERMGLLPRLEQVGYHVQRLSVVDEQGRERTGLDATIFSSLTDGRYLSLPRGDLAEIVFNACSDVEVRFGTYVTALDQNSERVRVGLSDGSEEQFDLVIGADGLHSRVRQLAFGPQSEFEQDLGYYACAFRLPDYPHRDELVYVSHTIPKRQMARFSLRDGSTLLFLVFHSDLVDRVPTGVDGVKAALRKVFAGMEWEAPEVLRRLDQTRRIYFDRVSQIRMDDWSLGRVALVGDAAACASLLAGEGSGLAMLEAYVLAGELMSAKGDHKTAF